MRAVLDVATLDMSQDNILEKIKTLFSNIAANGANTLNDESRRLAQQAYVVVDLDLVQAKSFVTISLLFVTQSEADAALAKFNAYGGTSKFLDDVVVDMTVPPSISFQSNPVINTFTLSTTANPIPIQQSGLQIDHISFKNDCLDSGCWVIDFTTAKFSDAGSHTLALLPQIVDGVGDLPTPSYRTPLVLRTRACECGGTGSCVQCEALTWGGFPCQLLPVPARQRVLPLLSAGQVPSLPLPRTLTHAATVLATSASAWHFLALESGVLARGLQRFGLT